MATFNFGTSPAPAPTGGGGGFGFGSGPAPPFGAPASSGGGGFGGFGTAAPSSTGYSFGGSGTPAPSFAFGSTAANTPAPNLGSAFGGASGPSTSAFGFPPAPSGGLLGGAPPAFGSAAPAPSLFGTAPTPAFGAQPAATGFNVGVSPSPFGAAPAFGRGTAMASTTTQRGARSTADSAMERAVAAEIASKAAVAEVKARLQELARTKFGASPSPFGAAPAGTVMASTTTQRAARSTAVSAMERAVAAEIASKAAVAEAKARLQEKERIKELAIESMDRMQKDLNVAQQILSEREAQLLQLQGDSEKRAREVKDLTIQLRETQSKLFCVQEELSLSHSIANSLIAILRNQVRKAEADRESLQAKVDEEAVGKSASVAPEILPVIDDSTVRILQDELPAANKSIDDLKEALGNAIAQKSQADMKGSPSHGEMYGANGDSSSTPLFFAMEKQAELKTARDEINRLANLLSNVQSEKMEAQETLELMRKRTEEAEARLRRFDKLVGPSSHNTETVGQANGRRAGHLNESGAVNIEYLKNIMLCYLNAKTVAERKALVPVIGAVLCLTSDEQNKALQNVEESASLGSVGSSLFESFTSKLL